MPVKRIPKNAVFTKDPHSIGDYEVRWTNFLAANSDTIATGTFVIVSGDGALVKTNEQQTSSSMYVWLASGTHQQWYDVECKIDTTGGRHWERSIRIKVVQK